MSDLYSVPPNIQARALINNDAYQRMYRQSIEDPDVFWADQAKAFLDWYQPWHTVSDADLPNGNVRWFDGGELNVSVNCIDRHLPARANQTAIIWEGDEPTDDEKSPIKSCTTTSVNWPMDCVLEEEQRRPRLHLYADDS